jgi:spore coat protein A
METPTLSRRDVLKISVLGAAATALPAAPVLFARDASELDEDRLPRPYAAAFSAPPVLTPVASDDVEGDTYGTVPGTGAPIAGSRYYGTDYYRLTQQPTTVNLISGVKTTMWGYNGSVPGPTIRTYRTGGKPRRVVMQQINRLPATHPTLRYVPWTSTHLHGSPSKPQYDGYASDVTQPGEWKNYQYPNNCTPRTLWYHDHGLHHTAENVYMGLAAQYHVVDEALEQQLGIPRFDRTLPATAPQYEFPLILSDVMFAANGQLMYDDEGHSGLYGDVILVNGVPWPNMKVEPRKYRFRLLNGSIARGYDLYLSNGAPFQVIATDGGFMHKPQTVKRMRIGMAERYEIVIDFAPFAGTKVRLLNAGVDNARDYDHTGKIMQFEVGRTVTSTAGNTVPSVLGDPHPAMALQAGAATATRRLRVERTNGMWVINDQTWDDVVRSNYERIFANPEPNATEIWEVENSSGGWFHPVHIHLVDFQVLSRNGAPPAPYELGPKDVVYVGEGETVRLLMKFEHEQGRYMIHCHNTTHEDHDMMIQYQVGHHDVDCDSINTDPPKSGEPAPLVAATQQDSTATTTSTQTSSSTQSSSSTQAGTATQSSSTQDSTAAPTTTSNPTTSAPTTTSQGRPPRTTRPRGR